MTDYSKISNPKQLAYACALRKLIDGQAINGYIYKMAEPWGEIGQALIATPPIRSTRTLAFEAAIASLPDATAIREAVFAAELHADLDELFRLAEAQPAMVEMAIPPLPDSARLDPGLGIGAGAWIDVYTGYARAGSPMTPLSFHESAALALAATAIAGRLVLHMPFDDIRPNLFIAWVAPTTLYRKTTGMNIARKVAWNIFSHLLAPQDTTPEAFLSDLAGQQPANYATMTTDEQQAWAKERNFAAQRGWILDELSGLMNNAGKDYNAGLLESMLRFYDCDPSYTRSLRGQGRISVKNSCLTLLGASTPQAMAYHLNSETLWGNGWWPRFAILTPDPGRPEWKEAEDRAMPPEYEQGIRNLYERLPHPKWPDELPTETVVLAPGVYDAWTKYNRAVSYELLTPDLPAQLWGSYGRLPAIILKVAMILAALDWPEGQPCRIELVHLARAQGITETWRASVHRAIAGATETPSNKLLRRVIQFLSRAGEDGITMRDLCRAMRDKLPGEIELALTDLITAGMAEKLNPEPGRRGRPTDKYRLVTE